MDPGLNLGTPSIMFFSENLDKLYQDLSSKNITVGEIVNMPSGKCLTLPIMKTIILQSSKKVNNYHFFSLLRGVIQIIELRSLFRLRVHIKIDNDPLCSHNFHKIEY